MAAVITCGNEMSKMHFKKNKDPPSLGSLEVLVIGAATGGNIAVYRNLLIERISPPTIAKADFLQLVAHSVCNGSYGAT